MTPDEPNELKTLTRVTQRGPVAGRQFDADGQQLREGWELFAAALESTIAPIDAEALCRQVEQRLARQRRRRRSAFLLFAGAATSVAAALVVAALGPFQNVALDERPVVAATPQPSIHSVEAPAPVTPWEDEVDGALRQASQAARQVQVRILDGPDRVGSLRYQLALTEYLWSHESL